MPPDCILGYIYFDSLCRGLRSSAQVDTLLSRITSWDTLRIFMRFLYKMEEYDPDLFREYEFGAVYLDTNYNISPALVAYKFWEYMNNMLGRKNRYNYLSEVSLILHIRVFDVQTTYDSLCNFPFNAPPRKCVSAYVIDTVKGLHFRSCDYDFYKQYHKGSKPQDAIPCISIMYSPFSPKSYAYSDHIVIPIDTTSTDFPCDKCYGQTALESGKDYIVFLEDLFLDYNGLNSFYEYTPYPTYNEEGGIFPIDSNGNVLSEDDYFGYGVSTSLPAFETSLRSDIQSIILH